MLTALSGTRGAAGLHGGALVTDSESFKLDDYSLEPGVRVSGHVLLSDSGPPLAFAGSLTVDGPGASSGIVLLSGNGRLRGTLGDKYVSR